MTEVFVIPPAYPQVGEVLDGKYQIERLLGEGGMGAVAKATHLLRRAPVALKFMSPSVMMLSGAVERFINEGVAASQIDSDHVVKVYDVGRLPTGAPYLVMEYLEGQDLSDLLLREGTPGLPVVRAVHFTLQILRGLQVAHQAAIVHRDMKPSNCFVVRKEGEEDFVKLLDFGISKVQQPGGGHITRTNSALGTPLYMSPEQARSPKDVDRRSDIFSVGVILYELLTGQTPFHSDSGEFTEILFKIFTQDPPYVGTLRPDLPEDLCAAIHKALARNPDDRYGTAFEMAEGIAPWADERSTQVIVRSRAVQQGHMSQAPPAAEAAPTAAGIAPLAPVLPNLRRVAPEPPETRAAPVVPQGYTAELPGARNAMAPATAPIAARRAIAPVRQRVDAPQLTMPLAQAAHRTDPRVAHSTKPEATHRRAIILVGAGALLIGASIVALSAATSRSASSADPADAGQRIVPEPRGSVTTTVLATAASVSAPPALSSAPAAPAASARPVAITSKPAHSVATSPTGVDRVPDRQ
jgi:serine/threonine-protein kinase